MSDYTIYQPFIAQLTAANNCATRAQEPTPSLSLYEATLRFYGEPVSNDKIVFMLLYIDGKSLPAINRILSSERTTSLAIVFCRQVIRCVLAFCNPFTVEASLVELQTTLFDRTDEFITGVEVQDGKRYVRFIVELLWLMLHIRISFLNGRVVELLFNLTKLKQSLNRLEAYLKFEAPIIAFLAQALNCLLHNYFFRYRDFVRQVESCVKEENRLNSAVSLLAFRNQSFDTHFIAHKLNVIEAQGISVFVMCRSGEQNNVIYADQLESYFKNLLTHSHTHHGGYKILYASGGGLEQAAEIVEERGEIEDLVIHHSDKTGEYNTMATFAQIEKGCYLIFYRRFEGLRECATLYYRNFVVFQRTFPETLSYLRMDMMKAEAFGKCE